MNEQEKIKANMAAAKLLGREFHLGVNLETQTNIFENSADCLDVLKVLVATHNIDFKGQDNSYFWFEHIDGGFFLVGDLCKTLEDAVAAAVLEVSK